MCAARGHCLRAARGAVAVLTARMSLVGRSATVCRRKSAPPSATRSRCSACAYTTCPPTSRTRSCRVLCPARHSTSSRRSAKSERERCDWTSEGPVRPATHSAASVNMQLDCRASQISHSITWQTSVLWMLLSISTWPPQSTPLQQVTSFYKHHTVLCHPFLETRGPCY